MVPFYPLFIHFINYYDPFIYLPFTIIYFYSNGRDIQTRRSVSGHDEQFTLQVGYDHGRYGQMNGRQLNNTKKNKKG